MIQIIVLEHKCNKIYFVWLSKRTSYILKLSIVYFNRKIMWRYLLHYFLKVNIVKKSFNPIHLALAVEAWGPLASNAEDKIILMLNSYNLHVV